MCRLIFNLPEYSIRIFSPLVSYFLINRYEFRITDPDIRCCRIFRCAQQHVHIRQNNSLVAICAYGYVAARLLCRLICNLPELRIRIFNPLAS